MSNFFATFIWVVSIRQFQLILDSQSVDKASIVEITDGSYDVSIELTSATKKELGKITQAGIGKTNHIILGRKVISTAVIRSELGGNFVISALSKEEADKMLKVLMK